LENYCHFDYTWDFNFRDSESVDLLVEQATAISNFGRVFLKKKVINLWGSDSEKRHAYCKDKANLTVLKILRLCHHVLLLNEVLGQEGDAESEENIIMGNGEFCV
jgi:hypothetical protein